MLGLSPWLSPLSVTLLSSSNMHPTNADLKKSFDDHARHDALFQSETGKVHQSILDSLKSLHDKLNPDHEDYINRHIETELKEMKTQMQPLIEIYNGFVFGRKALIWTAGSVGAVSVLAAAVKFFKI